MKRDIVLLKSIMMAPVIMLLVSGIGCRGPRPREIAARHSCQSALKSVYNAIQGYRDEHHGTYPGRLEDLYPHYLPSRDWLRCSTRPHRCFTYLGPQVALSRRSILVYDDPESHNRDYGPGVRPCVIVLLSNGEVAEMKPRVFRKKLRQQLSSGGR